PPRAGRGGSAPRDFLPLQGGRRAAVQRRPSPQRRPLRNGPLLRRVPPVALLGVRPPRPGHHLPRPARLRPAAGAVSATASPANLLQIYRSFGGLPASATGSSGREASRSKAWTSRRREYMASLPSGVVGHC